MNSTFGTKKEKTRNDFGAKKREKQYFLVVMLETVCTTYCEENKRTRRNCIPDELGKRLGAILTFKF